jgi:ribosomal protein S18 acetylase RimI-like enzyme
VSFAVHADTWLGEVMRRPVFRVEGTGALGELAERRPGFYFAKVATDQIEDVAQLSRLGFVVVDTAVTFEQPADAVVAAPVLAGVEVGPLIASDVEAVLAIAGTAFRYSRFHLDPAVDPTLAHHIKRAWIESYVHGRRGDGLLVARRAGRPAGFLAHLQAGDHGVIDLIAVAAEAQGTRLGSALIAAFVDHYRPHDRRVGTQISNLPSIKLYTKHGFTLARSQYVLHLHVGA